MAQGDDRRSDPKAASASERKTCVICGKPRDPHYAPFCSKRCADVDLGRWLNGVYVVPGAKSASTEEDTET